jgi:hypothetical protein
MLKVETLLGIMIARADTRVSAGGLEWQSALVFAVMAANQVGQPRHSVILAVAHRQPALSGRGS